MQRVERRVEEKKREGTKCRKNGNLNATVLKAFNDAEYICIIPSALSYHNQSFEQK